MFAAMAKHSNNSMDHSTLSVVAKESSMPIKRFVVREEEIRLAKQISVVDRRVLIPINRFAAQVKLLQRIRQQ